MTERVGSATDQTMTSVLHELADVADETARDQQRLARRARDMIRQRRRGRSWSTILGSERQPGAVELLATSARRLAVAGGRFRAALGRALATEGLSTRRIARHFGVTHQRVSAMLGPRSP